MITTAIVFDRRHEAARKKTGALEIRVTADRVSKYFPTGISLRPGEFVAGAVTNRADAQELNLRLQILTRRVACQVNACLEDGRSIDAAQIRRTVWACRESLRPESVADWIDEHIPDLRLKAATARRYKVMTARLREFGRIASWHDVTTENICAFNTWLHERPGKSGTGARCMGVKGQISDAGVHNYHKCLKAALNLAVVMDRLEANPYSRLRGRFQRGDRAVPDFLTDDQMDAVRRLEFRPGSQLASARDLCVVQMFTGLAWSDLEAFDPSRLQDHDGRLVAVGRRTKTGTPYVVQILPPVLEVLERYHWKLPMMSQAQYNDQLKVIGQAVGADFALRSHILRHTFATWALRHGVPVHLLTRMGGWKSPDMAMRYAKVMNEDVCREFDRLASGMK